MKDKIEFTAQQALTKILNVWSSSDRAALFEFIGKNYDDFRVLAKEGSVRYYREVKRV